MNIDVLVKNLPFLMDGLFITVEVAIISLILSLIIGACLGIVRFAKVPVLYRIVGLFVDLTRSIPLILYIVFVYFSIAVPLYSDGSVFAKLGIISLEMFAAILAIVLFSSAYIAEIIRTGLESVAKEQILAAKALSLNQWQTIECVLLPQAFSYMKPALCAQVITLVKDTSLASTIGLIELTRSAEIIYETSSAEFQILAFVALVYLSINFSIQKVFFPLKPMLST